MKGKVFLVGAGPGDPDLITRRASRLLSLADVVVVDALVSPPLFRTLKAKVIDVGKRGPGAASGSHFEMPQTAINRLLVRLAKQGKMVVRLKGGDPFVFGRGSEELEALRAARIPFEVVPGVSSVTGVPTFAGIPLTDRRFASQVTFITGQSKEDNDVRSPRVDWASLSPHQTLVVLMGVSRWPHIAKRLLQEGWPRAKPVAAIEWGTTPRERVLESKLGESSDVFKKKKLTAPAVIVVGEVVRFRKKLFGNAVNKPLLGKRIVVTRSLDQSASMVELLEKEGAEALLCPSIEIQPLRGGLRLKLRKVKYDWLVFLSANAVRTFRAVCPPHPTLSPHTRHGGRGKFAIPSPSTLFVGGEGRVREEASVLAIGCETKQVAESFGWNVKKMPVKFNSAGVLTALGPVRGKRILVPRVQNAPKDLTAALRRRGAIVDEVVTYRTKPLSVSPRMKKEILDGVDGISFTSSSIAESFLKSFTKKERRKLLDHAVVFSIGPQTSVALRKSGVTKIQQAKNSTTNDLVETMRTYFNSRP